MLRELFRKEDFVVNEIELKDFVSGKIIGKEQFITNELKPEIIKRIEAAFEDCPFMKK